MSQRGCFCWNARARNTHVEATLNHPFAAQAVILATVALKDEYSNINDGEYFLGLALPVLFMLVAAARLVAGAAGIMPSVCDKVGSAAPLSTS